MGLEICPRLVITGLKGGSGKTIAALGLVQAWREQGLTVAPFKKGPDYIDAGWLGYAAGRPCHNLDPFLMSRDVIQHSFVVRVAGTDVAVVEGNRGLYDGVDEEGSCSTAELSKWLDSPVVLVLDCTKMTRTAAALVLGCQRFDPEVRLAGMILNQVARSRHETMVRRTVERYCGVPVLGAIPRLKRDPLPMRHLGVTPCDEHPQAKEALPRLGRLLAESVDLEAVWRVACEAGPFLGPVESLSGGLYPKALLPERSVRIGVIRDAAFQFYYPENLEALEAAGAELVFFSALGGTEISVFDALYVGGGFPETQAERLAANAEMREGLRGLIGTGLPVYAECGGLMYLGRQIHWQDQVYPMVGVLSWDFVVEKRPQGHGYSVLEVKGPNPFFEVGTILQGHEFHYSRPVCIEGERAGALSCRVMRGHGFDGHGEGLVVGNVFGTYTHVHALERPDWAGRLVKAAAEYRSQRRHDDASSCRGSTLGPGDEGLREGDGAASGRGERPRGLSI